MRRFVRDQDWPIPYLLDETQDVARALGAERTPHVFVLDGEQRLATAGAPDGDHQDPARTPRGCARRSTPCSPAARPARRDARPRGAPSNGADTLIRASR